MNSTLTQKQLGQRITKLRKLKGLSQEDLATIIKLSRSSLAQVELGNRSVSALELQQLSMVLNFSLDDFMSTNYSTIQQVKTLTLSDSHKPKERVSVPALHVSKFKQVLLYILEKCAGKPNVGETVMYKLLYFADFNYYELYEEQLTGAKYRKLPFGPVPQKIDTVINEMIAAGMIQRIKTSYFDKAQTRYIPLVKADLTELKASEKDVIDKVIEHMSDWSASTISQYSHKDMPWIASKEGENINYELAFYREAPYSVRNYGDETDEQL